MTQNTGSWRLLRVFSLLVILCGPAATALAQICQIPAVFVDIGYGARPMGMGGAFVAMADDANSVLHNPAGLTRLDRTQLTGMYANQMSLVPHGFVGFARPLSDRTGLGVGTIYSGDAALREMTVLFSMAHRVTPGLDLGLSAKTRWAAYGNNPDGAWDPGGGNRQVKGHALGLACDIGLLYAVGARTTVGLMWRDFLAPITWEAQNEAGTARGGAESIPMAMALGMAHRLGDGVNLALNLDRSLASDASYQVRLGYEKCLWELMFLRLGYGQQISATPDRLYSVGLGVVGDIHDAWLLQFDFAYLFHQLANTPRVSMTLAF